MGASASSRRCWNVVYEQSCRMSTQGLSDLKDKICPKLWFMLGQGDGTVEAEEKCTCSVCTKTEWKFVGRKLTVVWKGRVKQKRTQKQRVVNYRVDNTYNEIYDEVEYRLDPDLTFSFAPHGKGICEYFAEEKLVATFEGTFDHGSPVRGRLTYEEVDENEEKQEHILYYEGNFEQGYEYGPDAFFRLRNGRQLRGLLLTSKNLKDSQLTLHEPGQSDVIIKFADAQGKIVAPMLKEC